MFAVAAVVAFAVSLILEFLGHVPGKDVMGFALGGALLVAAHLAWPLVPWSRARE